MERTCKIETKTTEKSQISSLRKIVTLILFALFSFNQAWNSQNLNFVKTPVKFSRQIIQDSLKRQLEQNKLDIERLKLITTPNERIKILKEINTFPFWNLEDSRIFYNAGHLYRLSTKMLMQEYLNLKEIDKLYELGLSVLPGYIKRLKSSLRSHIMDAGGIWEDNSELTIYEILKISREKWTSLSVK